MVLKILSKRHRTVVPASLGGLTGLLALLFYFLYFRPVTVWDFSKTHTLADIGVTQPLLSVGWINSTYIGPTSNLWLGEFPGHHLNLVIRLSGDVKFKFRNANASFYGRNGALGGMTVRSGRYSYFNGGPLVESWLNYWHFPKGDRHKLRQFLATAEGLAKDGHFPEIDLYYDTPRGPSVAAAIWAAARGGYDGCYVSVSIFWVGAHHTPGATTLVRQSKDRQWSR